MIERFSLYPNLPFPEFVWKPNAMPEFASFWVLLRRIHESRFAEPQNVHLAFYRRLKPAYANRIPSLSNRISMWVAGCELRLVNSNSPSKGRNSQPATHIDFPFACERVCAFIYNKYIYIIRHIVSTWLSRQPLCVSWPSVICMKQSVKAFTEG